MPTYPHMQLGEFAQIFVGLARQSKAFSAQPEQPEIGLIGMKAIRPSGVDLQAIEYVQVAAEESLSVNRVAENDVLITCRGTEIRLALAPRQTEGMLIDSNILAIRSEPILSAILLATFFHHPLGMSQLERASQSTTTQKNLTVRAVKKITVPVPPAEAQRQISRLVLTAEKQYGLAAQCAERRLAIARQIAVDLMFEKEMEGKQK